MVTEKNKYRAQIFQICGFALMGPLGKLVIDLKEYKLMDYNFYFFIYAFIYGALFFCGMLLVGKGLDFLDSRRIE